MFKPSRIKQFFIIILPILLLSFAVITQNEAVMYTAVSVAGVSALYGMVDLLIIQDLKNN